MALPAPQNDCDSMLSVSFPGFIKLIAAIFTVSELLFTKHYTIFNNAFGHGILHFLFQNSPLRQSCRFLCPYDLPFPLGRTPIPCSWLGAGTHFFFFEVAVSLHKWACYCTNVGFSCLWPPIDKFWRSSLVGKERGLY